MTIRTATLDNIAIIEIARPEKKNAITAEMYIAMGSALMAASEDAAVLAVLIVGQPGIFTSGNDLDDFMSQPPRSAGSGDTPPPALLFMRALVACEKPVIAAVTGAAIGIGATMLLHCDFVYVSDEARLAMPFVSLGLVPEFGASFIVPQLMGKAGAAEKLLLGDPFTGEQAVEYGIANAVLPAGEVVHHARRVAARFNKLPPGAVRDTKKLMRQHDLGTVLKAIDDEAALFAARLRSPEAQEAFQAFFQKRPPDFSQF
jgi:enoyl-CoA hydratase/carnithine racemase